MNPCSQDLLQFLSLFCVTWSEKQQKVIQTAEKAAEFFMVLKEKESASNGEAFLSILVDILGATLHFELDHCFF